jgi:hypothetical protein
VPFFRRSDALQGCALRKCYDTRVKRFTYEASPRRAVSTSYSCVLGINLASTRNDGGKPFGVRVAEQDLP